MVVLHLMILIKKKFYKKEYVKSEQYEYENIVNLLIGFNHYSQTVRIWNFHTNEILTEYNNLFENMINRYDSINGINIYSWNHYLIISIDIIRYGGRGGGRWILGNQYIKLISLKTEKFVENSITKFNEELDCKISFFSKINFHTFGECLLTKIKYDKIILWKEGEIKKDFSK